MSAKPHSPKIATQPGRWIKTLEGYRAFHPNPLPPTIEWTQPLAVALANASTLIGRLAGEGRRLPNPHVLIRPFVRREAVFSSRIEGTRSTLGELLAAEAGAAVERSRMICAKWAITFWLSNMASNDSRPCHYHCDSCVNSTKN